MVHGIKRGVIQFLTVTILGGICLVFGFAPDEFLAGLVTDPPPWLSHPALRIIALILGGVLGYVGWRVIVKIGRTHAPSWTDNSVFNYSGVLASS